MECCKGQTPERHPPAHDGTQPASDYRGLNLSLRIGTVTRRSRVQADPQQSRDQLIATRADHKPEQIRRICIQPIEFLVTLVPGT